MVLNAGHAAAGKSGEGVDESGRAVQRFCAEEFHSALRRILPKEDVDVVKHLHMVTDEANRLHQDGLMSRIAQRVDSRLNRGPDPGAAGHALALKRETPLLYSFNLLHDQRGGFLRLRAVGI